MAREVGLLDGRDDWSSVPEEYMTCIKDFEALVRADEREQAEERVTDLFVDMETPYLLDIVTAIRAKGETK
jgi:hypothetical protein